MDIIQTLNGYFYWYNVKGNGYGIFTPMTNKYFNRLFEKIRKKHKAYLISRYKVKDFMSKLDTNKYHLFGFAADQSPRKVGKSYINNFLGHKVPIFTGAERFSKTMTYQLFLLI